MKKPIAGMMLLLMVLSACRREVPPKEGRAYASGREIVDALNEAGVECGEFRSFPVPSGKAIEETSCETPILNDAVTIYMYGPERELPMPWHEDHLNLVLPAVDGRMIVGPTWVIMVMSPFVATQVHDVVGGTMQAPSPST